jgi:hypothetical protein
MARRDRSAWDAGEELMCLYISMVPFVICACENKARKDYSDCILVIAIAPDPPFAGFQERYEERLQALVARLSMICFNAKQVFMLILPSRVEAIHG